MDRSRGKEADKQTKRHKNKVRKYYARLSICAAGRHKLPQRAMINNYS